MTWRGMGRYAGETAAVVLPNGNAGRDDDADRESSDAVGWEEAKLNE